MKSQKEETLDEKWAKRHPKFLEAIRDTQPLAYLASFMLLIAIFSTNELAGARTFAIGSSIVFLGAFLSSLIYKMFNITLMALWSYIATGIGIFLSILVIVEFANTIPMVSSAYSTSIFLLMMIVLLIPVNYEFLKSLREDWKNGVKKNALSIFGNIFLVIGFGLITTYLLIFGVLDLTGIRSIEPIHSGFFWFCFSFVIIGAILRLISNILGRVKNKKY